MLFDDTYYEIKGEGEGLYKSKGSKFLAYAYNVHSEEEVKTRVEALRKQYYDARHYCYAYILHPDKSASRANDDGEPSGSAGKPIYNQLLSYNLTNVLVVVVRYFGGTKLGVPGLIEAYKTATKEALDVVKIEELHVQDVYSVHFTYDDMNVVMRYVKEENLTIIHQDFALACELHFAVRQNDSERVKKRFEEIYTLKIKYEKTI